MTRKYLFNDRIYLESREKKMFTQIYAMQSVKESLACIEAGADRIGLLVGEGDCPYPCHIPFTLAQEIYAAIGDKAQKILISVHDKEEDIIQECHILQPDILHLCAEFQGSASFREHLRNVCPQVKLMEAVGVRDESAIAEAIQKARYADILILDSVSTKVPGVGAAGITHDWSIDRRIVESVDVPVVLAGGLGPENVEAAIKAVAPAGVDSLTKTSVVKNGKLLRKDIAKVAEFCKRAKKCGSEY